MKLNTILLHPQYNIISLRKVVWVDLEDAAFYVKLFKKAEKALWLKFIQQNYVWN